MVRYNFCTFWEAVLINGQHVPILTEGQAERNHDLPPGPRRRPSEVLGRPDLRQDHLREEGRVREGRKRLANLLQQTSGSVPHIPCVFIL